LIKRRIDAHEISGAVTLVARRGRVAHFEATGLMDIASKRMMRRDALFSIASMSKPVTAVAILMLLEEGKLHLNDPVSIFIPQFHTMKAAASAVPAREITIRDLLTHVSGLMSGGPISTAELPKINHRKGETLANVIPRLGTTTLDFEPGTRWSYSPTVGFDTLGRIVEIVSGQRFDRFLRQRVFNPLDMRDATFLPSAAQAARLTTIYHRSDAGGPLLEAADDGWLTDVAPSSVFVPDTFPGRVRGIGFGLAVRVYQAMSDNGVSAGSYGWDGSYGTHFWIDPKEQLLAIIMIQDDNPDGQISRDFESAVTQAILD
jgi:CubicO group peptidase (beta-lactamase class C family)